MKKVIVLIFLSCFVHFTNAQATAGDLVGIHNVTTFEMNAIDSAISGSLVYNTDINKLMVFNGTIWESSANSSNNNWSITGNTGVSSTNFLGNIDDVKMQIRSNNLSMLEFGRRETLGLYADFPDYRDNDQSLVYVKGNNVISALQFAASGADFYKPMFFTTTNGSFRLKGSAGKTDLFEIGSAGPANNGRLEFIIGDDGAEPIIFKRYNYYDATNKELFRVQGSSNSSNAKTRFGININPVGVPIDGTYNDNDTGNIANSTLQINGSVSKSIVTTSGDLTLTEDYHTLILGGNHTITLPAATICSGRVYVIKNMNAVETAISAYINEQGTTVTAISSNIILRLQSDGVNWQQIAGVAGVTQALNQNTISTGTGEITLSDGSGSANVVSANANNSISVGTDGGAYKALRIFDGYDSTGGQSITSTFMKLNIDKTRTNLSGFTLAADNITIPENGVYEITYNVTFRNTSSSRSTILSELRLNNTRIDASDLYTYHRINNGSYQTSSRTIIISLTQNNLLSIYSKRFEGSGSLRTVADATSISIKKLD